METNILNSINQVIHQFFQSNKDIDKIPAKDLMPLFIKAGIFDKDTANGLPIRQVLRDLDRNKQLKLIPSTLPERKKVYTKWYFIRSK